MSRPFLTMPFGRLAKESSRGSDLMPLQKPVFPGSFHEASDVERAIASTGESYVLTVDGLGCSGRHAHSMWQCACSVEGACDVSACVVSHRESGRPLDLLPRSGSEGCTDSPAASRASLLIAHVRAAAYAAGGSVSHGCS